ncbi:MAG: carbohydrate porin [Cyanobacteria bacterium CRU_2_1]|nr:carbohydrate porin [Cyanobacteria bacterium CRU_2_1]
MSSHIGDRASLYISTSGDDLSDFNPSLGDDAISEFGAENPIHSLVEDVGLQLNYELIDELSISLGYFSGDAGNPEPGAGLFNGNQSAFVQLEFEPSDREASPQENHFLLGLTYIHTYNDSSLETETGSFRSQINLERPVVGNSYGVSASFAPNPRTVIGGWAGFTNATVIDLGDASVWNYALTLAFPDLGQEGNLLGIVIGQEPRLTGTSGFRIDDRRSDPDTSLHIEIFYRDRLSDYISVTPGLVWITAPNHDNSNPDILVFTVRTIFEF